MRLLAVKHPSARTFYDAEALRGGWTHQQLDRQIQSQFYEQTLLSKSTAVLLCTLPAVLLVLFGPITFALMSGKAEG